MPDFNDPRQQVLPWDEGTGQERKAAALATLAALRHNALFYVRTQLIRLLHHKPWVTADDASRYFDEWLSLNPGQRFSRAFLGATFRADGWTPLSPHPDMPSTQAKNHGRLLLRWTYRAPGA